MRTSPVSGSIRAFGWRLYSLADSYRTVSCSSYIAAIRITLAAYKEAWRHALQSSDWCCYPSIKHDVIHCSHQNHVGGLTSPPQPSTPAPAPAPRMPYITLIRIILLAYSQTWRNILQVIRIILSAYNQIWHYTLQSSGSFCQPTIKHDVIHYLYITTIRITLPAYNQTWCHTLRSSEPLCQLTIKHDVIHYNHQNNVVSLQLNMTSYIAVITIISSSNNATYIQLNMM